MRTDADLLDLFATGTAPGRRRRPADRRLPGRRSRRDLRHAAAAGRRGPPAGDRAARWQSGLEARRAGLSRHVRVEGLPVHGGLPADGRGGRRRRRRRRRRARPGAGRRRRSGRIDPPRQRQDRRRDRCAAHDGRRRASSWSTTSTTSTVSSADRRPDEQGVLVRITPGVEGDDPRLDQHRWPGRQVRACRSTRPPPRCAAPRAHPLLRVDGVHIHIGSQILEADPFAASVRTLADLLASEELGAVRRLRPRRRPRRPLHVRRRSGRRSSKYLDALAGAARSAAAARRARARSSPAARCVASSAATIYRVVTRKRTGCDFVAIDGGMARQPRGLAVRAALRNRPRGAAARRRRDRSATSSAGTASRATGSSTTRCSPTRARRRSARRAGHRRLLLHDGEQLQRRLAPPGRVRARR